MHIAAETGLIEDPILPKLNEVQDLRVKLEKMKMRMGFAEESQEAKTNCTICEEMVSFLHQAVQFGQESNLIASAFIKTSRSF